MDFLPKDIVKMIYRKKHELEFADSLEKIEDIEHEMAGNSTRINQTFYVYHNNLIVNDRHILITIQNYNKFTRIQDVIFDGCKKTIVYTFYLSDIQLEILNYDFDA